LLEHAQRILEEMQLVCADLKALDQPADSGNSGPWQAVAGA